MRIFGRSLALHSGTASQLSLFETFPYTGGKLSVVKGRRQKENWDVFPEYSENDPPNILIKDVQQVRELLLPRKGHSLAIQNKWFLSTNHVSDAQTSCTHYPSASNIPPAYHQNLSTHLCHSEPQMYCSYNGTHNGKGEQMSTGVTQAVSLMH